MPEHWSVLLLLDTEITSTTEITSPTTAVAAAATAAAAAAATTAAAVATTTAAAAATTAAAAAVTTTPHVIPPTEQARVDISVTLTKSNYTADLADKTSSAYISLKTDVVTAVITSY